MYIKDTIFKVTITCNHIVMQYSKSLDYKHMYITVHVIINNIYINITY